MYVKLKMIHMYAYHTYSLHSVATRLGLTTRDQNVPGSNPVLDAAVLTYTIRA